MHGIRRLLAITILFFCSACAPSNVQWHDPMKNLAIAEDHVSLKEYKNKRIAIVLSENAVDFSRYSREWARSARGRWRRLETAHDFSHIANLYVDLIRKYFEGDIVLRRSLEEARDVDMIILVDQAASDGPRPPANGRYFNQNGGMYFINPATGKLLAFAIGKSEQWCGLSLFITMEEVDTKFPQCISANYLAVVKQIDAKLQTLMAEN